MVPSAVSAADAAAIAILRRTSQILFFFIALCVFKLLINRVNCVYFKVLDYLLFTLQSYEKFLNYTNIFATFFALFRRKKGLLRVLRSKPFDGLADCTGE